MKKFLALALVLAIFCSFATACGGDSDDKDETPKIETPAEDNNTPTKEEDSKLELEDTTKEEQKPEDNEDLTDEPPIDF